MIPKEVMDELKKALDADFEPAQAFRSSGLNPQGEPTEALRLYLKDRAEIEARQPSFYDEPPFRRIDAYVKFMLKRLQYGLEIPEWKIGP